MHCFHMRRYFTCFGYGFTKCILIFSLFILIWMKLTNFRFLYNFVVFLNNQNQDNLSLPGIGSWAILNVRDKTYTYTEKLPFSHCDTCAVVFSSGVLLFHPSGLKIDSSDCVIRINTAPVAGYEEYVGERTTYRLVRYASVTDFSLLTEISHLDPSQQVILTPKEDQHPDALEERWADAKGQGWVAKYRRQYVAIETTGLLDSDNYHLLSSKLREDALHLLNSVEIPGVSPTKLTEEPIAPTEGLVSVLFALKFCNHTSIYGVPSAEDFANANIPYHYWDEKSQNMLEQFSKSPKHEFPYEYELYKFWKNIRRDHLRPIH